MSNGKNECPLPRKRWAELRGSAGSARAYLGEAALPTVRALNRVEALMLLPAMHLVESALRRGLVDTRRPSIGT